MLHRVQRISALVAYLFIGSAGFAQSWENPVSGPVGQAPINQDADRLLAEALAAQATWWNFPGFHAEVTVMVDGRSRQGRIIVAPDGRVHVEHLDRTAADLVRTRLADIACARLGKQSASNRFCYFASTGDHAQFGKAVIPWSDPIGSTCWVRQKQIQMTQQRFKDRKEIVQLVDSEKNQEGALLPKVVVASQWDPGTNQIKKTTTVLVAWKRTGRFDLPDTIRVICAGEAQVNGKALGAAVSTITLSGVKLEEPPLLSTANKTP
jgi:hypothetical protein